MSLEFTVEELKNVSCVAITLNIKPSFRTNNEEDAEVTGLFLGIQPLTESNTALSSRHETFIWLKSNNMCHIHSTRYYEVDKIYITKEDKLNAFYTFTGKLDDLDEGKGRLAVIQKAMKESKRVTDKGLIEASTYKSIPVAVEKLMKPKESNSSTSTGGVARPTATTTKTTPITTYGSSHYSAYKKKEVTTLIFKRTTRYNVKAAIDSMWEKVEALRAGTYEAPALKNLEKEKEEETKEAEKKASAVTSTNDDDDLTDEELHELESGCPVGYVGHC